MTAAGVSIITPTGISSSKEVFSSFNSLLALSSMTLACVTSSMDVIIGNMIDRFPNADARRIARNWVLNSSSLSRETRIPRYPMAGLASSPRSRHSATLSPPRSAVRMTTFFEPMDSAASLYAWNCCSSVGGLAPFSMYRNSLLNSPIPPASQRITFSTSSRLPILAQTSILWPL